MRKMLMVLSALTLSVGAAALQDANAQSAAPPTAPPPGSVHSQAPSPGTSAERKSAPSVDQLMNRVVVGADGKRIGTVTDVVLDPDGQARLIVIHSGGILGIGGKDIAADLHLAEIATGADSIMLREVTAASVRDTPEFRYDDSVTSLNRSPSPRE